MSRSLVMFIAALVAIVVAGVALLPGNGPAGDSGASFAAVTLATTNAPPASMGPLPNLVVLMVIDSEVKVPRGGGAFAVLRNGDLRPPGDALAFVRSLLAASERGDALATYNIFLAVLDCRRLLRGPAQPSGIAGQVLTRLAECQPLLEDIELSMRDWITLAADQGSIEAMLTYPNNPAYVLGDNESDWFRNPERAIEWKQRARHYLEAAAKVGSQDAMLALSNAYGDGMYVEKDSELQYAYAVVAQKMHPIHGLDQLIDSYERGLVPAAQRRGMDKARIIYDSCCGKK